jgi:phosphatidylglycerophosphatase A
MSSKLSWRECVPRYQIPRLPAMTTLERVALAIATGLGSGFAKPMAPSWGSIPGFLYFVAVSALPHWKAVVVFAALLPVAVWSGTISERLLGTKDPSPVVIDEIAAVPFALWPLWIEWPGHLVTWVILFGVYRLADFLKPWPANSLQSLKGGLGILIDDLISSLYMGMALLAFIRFCPGWL